MPSKLEAKVNKKGYRKGPYFIGFPSAAQDTGRGREAGGCTNTVTDADRLPFDCKVLVSMFNSTHTLVGLALARTGMDRWSRHAAWTAVIASNLPDIDIVAGLYDTPAYIEYHRGITHSIAGIPLLSIALAAAMYRFSGNFLKTTVIALLATSSHLLLDYLNTYGIRPFLPFDGTWFYGDALFIIDPLFDAVLIAMLAAGHFLPAHGRRLAVIGLAVVTLYVGLRLELRNLSRSYI